MKGLLWLDTVVSVSLVGGLVLVLRERLSAAFSRLYSSSVIDDLTATSPEHLRIQLQTARALFQTMSGFSAQAALAVVSERSPS